MSNELLNQLLPKLVEFVITILGVIGSYVLVLIKKYIDEKKAQVIATGKSDQYNHALSIAKGMFVLLEGEFVGIEKSGLSKKSEMEKRLLQLFPQISQTELDSINKQVWQELNDKIVTPIITPVPVASEVQQTISDLHSGDSAPDLTKEQPQA